MTKIAALTGVLTGIALLALGRGATPAWLAGLQVVFFSAVALLYGFTAFSPRAPAWLSSRPVVGVALVYLGVAVMFVPANFVVSSACIGLGTRLLMGSNFNEPCIQENTTLARRTTGTEIRS